MADPIRMVRDGTIIFFDGTTPTRNEVNIPYDMGNFELDVPGRDVELFLVRNQIQDPPDIRLTTDNPLTFKFSLYLKDVVDASIRQHLLDGAIPAGWASTNGAESDFDTLGIEFQLEGSAFSGTDRTMTLKYCNLTGGFKEGDAGEQTVSGIDYEVYPTIA